MLNYYRYILMNREFVVFWASLLSYITLIWQVLCSSCCNLKSRLPYMDNKEARVCVPCHQILEGKRYNPTPVSKHQFYSNVFSILIP